MSGSNKYVLAEQVIRILQGGDYSDDTQIDEREVAMFIEQAFSVIIRRRLFDERDSTFQWMNGSYLYTFKNVAVNYDQDLDLYYSNLPQTAISLPNDSGIQLVTYMKNQYDAIIPVPPNFLSMFSKSPAAGLQGNAGYFVEGKRIYFVNWEGVNDACKVLIKMFITSLGGNEDDAFAIDECNLLEIPLDMQQEIIQYTLQIYGVQKNVEKDITNDHIDG